MSGRLNRLREAREYVGFSLDDAAGFIGVDVAVLVGFEIEKYQPGEQLLAKMARLYRRPVEWLKGEPAPPVPISPELARLMERLSDNDRSEVVAFAEFLQGSKTGVSVVLAGGAADPEAASKRQLAEFIRKVTKTD